MLRAPRMEIFLRITGETSGPHTSYQVREMLRSGTIDGDTLTWAKGMEKWVPLREFSPMSNDPLLRVADAGAEEISVTDEEREAALRAVLNPDRPRPWLRFWARSIDVFLFTTVVTLLAAATGFAEPSDIPYPTNGIGLTLAVPAAWIFVEAALLLYFKTTPGKWLMNIHLSRSDGAPLEAGQAFRRSFSVWWRGWGAGVLPLLLIGCALAHLSLVAHGKTAWDIRDDLEIKHEPVPEWRVLIAIVLMIGASMAIVEVAGPPEMPQLPSP